MADALNGDLSVRCVVDSAAMPWTPSPSPNVKRKRLHLVGPAESGQVTSIVRYEPGSRFPVHEHPDGEEILVLEGVFSDEHGDWPAGTYLLNPEGFRHKPFSREGCVLFVKLRQFPGADRDHVVLNTHALTWQAGHGRDIAVMPLYTQVGFSDTMRLERWSGATTDAQRFYPLGAELLVLEGDIEDEDGSYREGTWLRLPAGSRQRARTTRGCTLYVKEGGFAYLRAIVHA
jgi:hypothetical protein